MTATQQGSACSADNLVSIEDLAARAKQGDQGCLEALVDRYFNPVYRFVLTRLAGDVSEAQDVCGDTWECVVRNIKNYQYRPDSGGFPAWLFTIASNQLKTTWRRRQRHPEIPTADMLRIADSPTVFDTTAEVVVESAVVADIVVKALEELHGRRAKYRQVLLWRFYIGLSVAETAAMMSRSESSVKVLQHRALSMLAMQIPRTRTSVHPTTLVTMGNLADDYDPRQKQRRHTRR